MSELITDNKQDDINEILNDDINVENDEKEESERKDGEIITAPITEYQICSGEALSCNEIYRIAAKESTKMIVLVGPAGSGKTTIETSIYQLFQNNPVGKLYFAGSSTLQGYEQRSFYTRIKSQRDLPATQRTSLESDHPFLHLRLWEYERDLIHNLMFADLSGESFTEHIGQIDAVKEDFSFIDRADYIVGVLDGTRLTNKRKVRSTVEGVIELVRTFYDAELISEECDLQIVFSKYDSLATVSDAEQLVSKVKKQVEKRLEGMFRNVEFFEVAAMPDNIEKFPIGHGLERLIESWLKNRNNKLVRKNPEFAELSEFDRLYNKFLGVKE